MGGAGLLNIIVGVNYYHLLLLHMVAFKKMCAIIAVIKMIKIILVASTIIAIIIAAKSLP